MSKCKSRPKTIYIADDIRYSMTKKAVTEIKLNGGMTVTTETNGVLIIKYKGARLYLTVTLLRILVEKNNVGLFDINEQLMDKYNDGV